MLDWLKAAYQAVVDNKEFLALAVPMLLYAASWFYQFIKKYIVRTKKDSWIVVGQFVYSAALTLVQSVVNVANDNGWHILGKALTLQAGLHLVYNLPFVGVKNWSKLLGEIKELRAQDAMSVTTSSTSQLGTIVPPLNVNEQLTDFNPPENREFLAQ